MKIKILFLTVFISCIAFSQENSIISGQDITKKIKKMTITETVTSYSYASKNKKNPFVPPLASEIRSKVEIPIVSPLQNYRLSEIKLIGVWSVEGKEPKCLISTPHQEGIIVGIGDFIGNKGGVIHKIDSQGIKIREFNLLQDGTRIFKDTSLNLGDTKLVQKDKNIIIESSN